MARACAYPIAPCEEDPDNHIYLNDYNPSPDVADWDGDGDLDLLAGGYITGRVWYYENIAADKNAIPTLKFRGPLQANGKDLDVSWMASTSVDSDGDGDRDLICGAMQMNKIGGDPDEPDRKSSSGISKTLARAPIPSLLTVHFQLKESLPMGPWAAHNLSTSTSTNFPI